MPFRKLEADVVVDERLHRLVQAKAARGVPALREVQTMLAAYIADFNAVDPAIQAYKRGRVTDFSDSNSLTGEDSDSKLRWDDFRDWTRYNAHREDSSIPLLLLSPRSHGNDLLRTKSSCGKTLWLCFRPLLCDDVAWHGNTILQKPGPVRN